jgi:hypothetical protein
MPAKQKAREASGGENGGSQAPAEEAAAKDPDGQETLGNAGMLDVMEGSQEVEVDATKGSEALALAEEELAAEAKDPAKPKDKKKKDKDKKKKDKDKKKEKDNNGGKSGLGDEVDALVGMSPALAKCLESAEQNGWTVKFGKKGRGTRADLAAKVVLIDPEQKGDTKWLARSLAHELGHANYELEDHIDFGVLSKIEYIKQNTYRHLRDEAEATITELEVRDDLIHNGGPDMGIGGFTAQEKIRLWEKHKKGDISREDLVKSIAELYATKEEPSGTSGINYFDYYSEDYEDFWDEQH